MRIRIRSRGIHLSCRRSVHVELGINRLQCLLARIVARQFQIHGLRVLWIGCRDRRDLIDRGVVINIVRNARRGAGGGGGGGGGGRGRRARGGRGGGRGGN